MPKRQRTPGDDALSSPKSPCSTSALRVKRQRLCKPCRSSSLPPTRPDHHNHRNHQDYYQRILERNLPSTQRSRSLPPTSRRVSAVLLSALPTASPSSLAIPEESFPIDDTGDNASPSSSLASPATPPAATRFYAIVDPSFGDKVCEAFDRKRQYSRFVHRLRVQKYGPDIATQYPANHTPRRLRQTWEELLRKQEEDFWASLSEDEQTGNGEEHKAPDTMANAAGETSARSQTQCEII